MDSRPPLEALRSQDVMAAWSRVYRLGGYYIDLSLKVNLHSAVLLGQILPVTKGLRGSLLVLKNPAGQILHNIPIGEAGDFRSVVLPGVYDLEIHLLDQTLLLPLEV